MANKIKFLIIAAPIVLFYWNKSEIAPVVAEQITEKVESIGKVNSKPAKDLWGTVLKKVNSLADDDQAGLDALYEEARPLLEKAKVSLDYLNRENLIESFFVMNAWIRYNEKPEALVLSLLKEPVTELPKGGHHSPVSAQEKKLRLLAHGLATIREMHPKIADGDEFHEALRERIKTEKSLDVTIEAIQLLKESDARDHMVELLKERSLDDQKLLSKFL